MEKKVIAYKSNFSLITWISGIVMMVIVIVLSSEMVMLRYLAIIIIAYFLFHLVRYLFQPKVLIEIDDKFIYINKAFKIIALDLLSISSVEIKNKRSKAVKYDFGKIYIKLKNGEKMNIINVSSVMNVKSEILTFIRKK